jgi:hypothetical protein
MDGTKTRLFASDGRSIRPRFLATSVGTFLFERHCVLSCIECLVNFVRQVCISEWKHHTSNRKDVAKFLESKNQDIQLPSDTMHFTGAIVAFVTEDDKMNI